MGPIKRSGFAQGLRQTSATAKEQVGTLRITQDGRKFRYARAGASALAAGKMNQMATQAAAVVNEAGVAAAVAVGTRTLTLTITSATIAEDYFKGGQLQINDATGEGYYYDIESSTAVTAGTEISITLSDGIAVALDTTTEFTLAHNPYMAVVEAAVEENMATGVPLVAVPANYYFWSQTGGMACCLTTATPAVGTGLILSATVAGSLDDQVTALDVDEPVCALCIGAAGRAGEYCTVDIRID